MNKNYLRLKNGEIIVKHFKSFDEMLKFVSDKECRESIWNDFPKIEWESKVYLTKLYITMKKRSQIKIIQNKENTERKRLYNIN